MTVVGLILAALKAIPALKDLFDEIASAWVAYSIASMKKELADAIVKATKEHDQRDLEKYIGSPRAGLPSGDKGAEIVDELPGVPKK